MARKKNLIVGLGNLLLQDEGVGVWFARYLRDELPNFDVFEAGSINFSLLHELRNRPLIIFVDALSPEFPQENIFFEIYPEMLPLKLSFHEVSIKEILQLAALAGIKSGRAFVFGVRAVVFSPHLGLTEDLRRKFAFFKKELINHLAGITS